MDSVYDSRLKVNKKRARNIMIIVGLIEKNIFSVLYLIAHCILLEYAGRADAMLLAELFPKLATNLITLKLL